MKRTQFRRRMSSILGGGMGRKLFMLILLFSVLLFSVLSVVIVQISSQMLYRETQLQLHNQTQQVLNAFEQHMSTLQNIVFTAAQTNSFQRLVAHRYSGYQQYIVYRDAYDYVKQTHKFYEYIDLYVFAPREHYVMGSRENNVSSQFYIEQSANTAWYHAAKDSLLDLRFVPNFIPPVTGGTDGFASILTMRAFPRWDINGFIAASLDKRVLDDLLRDTSLSQAGFLAVFDALGNAVYTSDPALYEASRQNLPDAAYFSGMPGDFEDEHLGRFYLVGRQSAYGNLRFVSFSDKTYLNSKVLRLQWSILLVVAISLVPLLIGAATLARRTTQPLVRLINFIHEVEQSDFTKNLDIVSADEVGELVRSFNALIASVRENQYLRKNAQLDALQKQTDPHFLYNTLESVKALAMKGDMEALQRMIGSLSDIFRYNTNHGGEQLTWAADEIKHIEDYLCIQQIRFGQRIQVRWRIDPGIMDKRILRFILQPIVENAIRYGMEAVESGFVLHIQGVHNAQGDLAFTIVDNGPGIAPARLDEIRQALRKGAGGAKLGVGLMNTAERLCLLYSEPYRLNVYSRFGAYTKVTILLPVQ